MFIFVEHILKLTIKFNCLFQFRFGKTVTISPLKGWNTLSVFLLSIYVPIEVSGLALMSPTKLLTSTNCFIFLFVSGVGCDLCLWWTFLLTFVQNVEGG